MSLYYPEAKDAIYGHVARNINMIKTFAEMHDPFISLKSLIEKENKLIINLDIRGCDILDKIVINNVDVLKDAVKN